MEEELTEVLIKTPLTALKELLSVQIVAVDTAYVVVRSVIVHEVLLGRIVPSVHVGLVKMEFV